MKEIISEAFTTLKAYAPNQAKQFLGAGVELGFMGVAIYDIISASLNVYILFIGAVSVTLSLWAKAKTLQKKKDKEIEDQKEQDDEGTAL